MNVYSNFKGISTSFATIWSNGYQNILWACSFGGWKWFNCIKLTLNFRNCYHANHEDLELRCRSNFFFLSFLLLFCAANYYSHQDSSTLIHSTVVQFGVGNFEFQHPKELPNFADWGISDQAVLLVRKKMHLAALIFFLWVKSIKVEETTFFLCFCLFYWNVVTGC